MRAPPVDVDAARPAAFGLADELERFASGWHAHRKHQLLYSASGALHLEVAGAQWLLPPQRAAWIPARLEHRVRASGRVSLRTLYLAPRLVGGGAGCQVFAVTPLGREMILHSMRWGPAHDPRDPTARCFFRALAGLCREWMRDTEPYRLPTARSAELARVMQLVLERLEEPPSLAEAARAGGMSARTLARRFADEAQLSYRKFVHDARMLRALELLARPGTRVTEAALGLGFDSLSAFTRAFEAFTGERPKDYRRRVTG